MSVYVSKNSTTHTHTHTHTLTLTPHTHTHTHTLTPHKHTARARTHTGVVQGAKSAEGLSANSFKKSLMMGGRDYMAEFRTKFGSTAAGNVL